MWIFAAVSLLGVLFGLFVLEETKGKNINVEIVEWNKVYLWNDLTSAAFSNWFQLDISFKCIYLNKYYIVIKLYTFLTYEKQ